MEKKMSIKTVGDNKKQDVSNSKPWPRSSKKRETTSNSSSKNDVNRKQPSQRGKSFDKRPRPRGAYNGCPLGGKTDTRLENGDAEIGSVFLPGSKKQNLNHLLNFHYAPRDGSRQLQGRGNRKPHGLVYTNTHKHNKELFLQSNCQFVVKADGDYTAYLIDPDIPICWDAIEQINVRVNEPLSCPICLGEAVAGRITRCGHTYCWSCLLHYFALSESSTRPCPICFQPIDKMHLKSVQGVWQHHVPVGGDIHMKLMRRMRGSIAVELAPPLELIDEIKPREKLPSVSERELSTLFTKLLTASHQEVNNIIHRERAELTNQLSTDLEHPEFVIEALYLLEKREIELAQNINVNSDYVLNQINENISDDVKSESEEQELFNFENHENPPVKYLNNENLDNLDTTLESIDKTDDNFTVSDPEKPKLVNDKYFYFYQAADGQAIFLHAINVRIIEATWGSLSMAPRDLNGLLLERASGSVEMESRRRLRCLQHLSIHCPYDLVEIQLKPPFVSNSVLQAFKGDLDDRKRLRQRRARDEKRREKVISNQEQIILGRGPELELNINSEEHFPAYQPEIEMSPPPNDWKWDKESDGTSSGPSPGPSSLSKDNSLSFAKMASGSGNWGIRATRAAPTNPKPRSESESSDKESGAPPAYNVSLSEAISAALMNTSLDSHDDSNIGREGKKKKKHKPKVLFTTGIQHRTVID